MRAPSARHVRCAGVALVLMLGAGASAGAQVDARAVEVRQEDVLARVISVSITNARLSEALMTLRRVHRVPLAWSGDVVPSDKRVTLRVQETAIRTVMATILSGSGLQIVVTQQGTIVVVPAPEMPTSSTGDALVSPKAPLSAANSTRAEVSTLRAKRVKFW